ncbi:MAG: redox-regulated ATPase YchF [Candidatus Aminicenantes bacterium]|nr:redox-regulated ATPase YchF [Candidatus Aminicenantes bacterium]
MDFTIFGYPRTGKTTLFNLLTGAGIEVKSYDDGKKDTNRRSCPIPDARLESIARLYPGKEIKPAVVEYRDLAGISYGEVKDSTFIDHLRRADGLTHVVRGFKNPHVPTEKNGSDPDKDIRSMEEELILTDLVQVESRLEKLEAELQKSKNPDGEKEREILKHLLTCLEEGHGIKEINLGPSEEKKLRSFAFLSQKPLLHMVNVDEKNLPFSEDMDVFNIPTKSGSAVMAFCGKVETELMELEEEEKKIFMKEFGLQEMSAKRYLKKSFELLSLITFFTIGENEIKAWTIPQNTTAPQAAGSIHTDMEKGFIKAEVIPWQKLVHLGSIAAARENAALRLEGKEYIVQDGDVITFRFNR